MKASGTNGSEFDYCLLLAHSFHRLLGLIYMFSMSYSSSTLRLHIITQGSFMISLLKSTFGHIMQLVQIGMRHDRN